MPSTDFFKDCHTVRQRSTFTKMVRQNGGWGRAGGGAGAPCAIRRIEENAFLEFAILSLLF